MRSARGLLAAIPLALAAGSASAEPAAITFTIDGSSEATVACRVTEAGAVRNETHAGRLPLALRFEADAVTCSVTAAGPVSVEAMNARGSRSRARSSGGQMTVSISQ